MNPILTAVIVFLWVALGGLFLFSGPVKNKVKRQHLKLVYYLGYEKIHNEANSIGWNIKPREFLAIIGLAAIFGVFLAVIFRNPIIVLAGLLAGVYFPKLLIQQYRKKSRLNLLAAIPDFGRILIARLLDYQSITLAMENVHHNLNEPMKGLCQEFIKDMGAGFGIEHSLNNLKSKVSFNKFNTFIETLLISHQEGYSQEALRALEKSIEAIENDLKVIQHLHVSTRKKKRELIYVILVSWAIPLMLGLLNTNNVNIFMETPSGKILILSYIVCTAVVLVKGEEYLSLRLEEL